MNWGIAELEKVGREGRCQHVHKARCQVNKFSCRLFCHRQSVSLKSAAFLFGRLNMLERFHSSVLQQLSNLEKDLHTLKCLEKDVLASSWFVQSLG